VLSVSAPSSALELNSAIQGSLNCSFNTDSSYVLNLECDINVSYFRSPLPQWQGKTIALGTFASGEAEEKCAKAKSLTRAWRSSMRPKPTREWVISELERLGIRIVSGGRSGRTKNDSGEDGGPGQAMAMGFNGQSGALVGMQGGPLGPQSGNVGGPMELLQNGSWGGPDLERAKTARRNSSLGLSLLLNDPVARNGSFTSLSGAMGTGMGNDQEAGLPNYQPYIGGGAAAAFNAMRDDFYEQQLTEKHRRGASNLDGSGRADLSSVAPPTNPNE
jgi:hypothetical protein